MLPQFTKERNHLSVKLVITVVHEIFSGVNMLQQFMKERNYSNVKSVAIVALKKSTLTQHVAVVHEREKPFKYENCKYTFS